MVCVYVQFDWMAYTLNTCFTGIYSHDFLCKKLEIYGFDNAAVSFLKLYLNERT